MTIYHLVCPVCGKHFDAMRSHRVFCSRRCVVKDSRDRNKDILGRRFCANCYREYQPKNKRGIYCSDKCRAIAWYRKHKKEGKK